MTIPVFDALTLAFVHLLSEPQEDSVNINDEKFVCSGSVVRYSGTAL